MSKKLGIIVAMKEELAILKAKVQNPVCKKIAGMEFFEGLLGNSSVVLVKSGIGKVNASVCAQILVSIFNVTALLNSGVAGTLNPQVKQGDIVISTDSVQHDVDTTAFGDPLGEIPQLGITFFKADDSMLKVARKITSTITNLNFFEGRVASGDMFVADPLVSKKIIDHFGEVCAVEMEGAAIAHVAYLNAIPYLIIRGISDSANGDAPLSYENFLLIAAKNMSLVVESFVKMW
ncbi:MAG: 5'-methylthioadenosine/adenosylhomocysteine nucleosidase [Treponemataceae bacterium]